MPTSSIPAPDRRLQALASAIRSHADDIDLRDGLLRLRAGTARLDVRIDTSNQIKMLDRSSDTAQLRDAVTRAAQIFALLDPAESRAPDGPLHEQRDISQLTTSIERLGLVRRRHVAPDRAEIDLALNGANVTVHVRARSLRVSVTSFETGTPGLGTFLARLSIVANRVPAWIEIAAPRALHSALRIPALHTGFRPVYVGGSLSLTRAPAA
jgi:hypothetical protein